MKIIASGGDNEANNMPRMSLKRLRLRMERGPRRKDEIGREKPNRRETQTVGYALVCDLALVQH